MGYIYSKTGQWYYTLILHTVFNGITYIRATLLLKINNLATEILREEGSDVTNISALQASPSLPAVTPYLRIYVFIGFILFLVFLLGLLFFYQNKKMITFNDAKQDIQVATSKLMFCNMGVLLYIILGGARIILDIFNIL